ncbi:hypothetical protein DTO282E5_5703 [Paecilomyces variotii]|nr:hypothetical protein DTO282E5_5703 [Paecilomyces variotii]
MDKSPDYKALYQQAERARVEAERARAEAERERAEAERERAEAEKKQSVIEQVKNQIEAERNLLQSKRQPTTFLEFIETCHVHISQPLRVETNKARSTGGSLTSPKGRLCPSYLRPWKNFHWEQTKIYETAIQLLQSSSNPCLFSSKYSIHDLGRRLCRRPLASEEDLQGYQRYGVEDQVREIIDALQSVSDIFSPGEGIEFDNYVNAFDKETNSVDDQARKRSIPDQFCVFRKGANRTLLFSMEYKAGHKLTDRYLRAGLRQMEFWKEVVQRVTIPSEGEEKLLYHAELLTGSAIVHAYDDMINRGTSFGCLITGNCQVFLHVPEDQPDTVEYYLAEPNLDVQAMRDQGDDEWMYTPVTAVGRLFTMCLMSIQSPMRNQHWRNQVIPQLHVWEVDFEYILSQLSDEEVHSSPAGSEYLPSSPLATSSRKRRKRTSCRPVEKGDCPPDDSDSEDISRNPDSTARKRALTFSSSPPQRQHRSGWQFKRTDDSMQESLDFCTQRCLLSLKTGDWLDENCPNVDRHRKANSKRHQIHVSDFLRLLKCQLDNDLDHYCAPFGESGISGFPFKISLMPFGYTIVGKGTTDRRWPVVRQEENVYQILHSVQGSAVPVFLGTIDIDWIYFYGGVRITHFLILSWGGYPFNPRFCEEERRNEYQRTKKDIRRLGVIHGDLHESNILWNTELGRVQLIDFHKAKLSPSNKRKQDSLNLSRPRKRIFTNHESDPQPTPTLRGPAAEHIRDI